MTTPRRAGAMVMLATALATGALSGCAGAGAATTTRQSEETSGGSSGSRAQLYSLQEMTEAADVVLTGTAGAQQVITESPGSAMTTTTTDLVVDEVLRADATTSAAAGSTVVVRQTTTAPGWTSSEPDAPLSSGQRYLLFLSPSGQGESAADFYPVGAVAGIYRADGDAFTRAVPDSGDDVPTTVTPEQVRG